MLMFAKNISEVYKKQFTITWASRKKKLSLQGKRIGARITFQCHHFVPFYFALPIFRKTLNSKF